MMRPRNIVVLLVKAGGLIKTVRFGKGPYIGDPVNAARVFNDLGVDELVLLDIEASRQHRLISTKLIGDIAEEMTAPLAVGGGVRTCDDIRRIIDCGVEKVIVGTAANNADLIERASAEFGSSTITVCMDVARGRVIGTSDSPVEFARRMESSGAGELIVQSVDRDGTFSGYDLPLIRSVCDAVNIPVVALGGAGRDEDLAEAVSVGGASAAAAGSLFVFAGKDRGVLINYAGRSEMHI